MKKLFVATATVIGAGQNDDKEPSFLIQSEHMTLSVWNISEAMARLVGANVLRAVRVTIERYEPEVEDDADDDSIEPESKGDE